MPPVLETRDDASLKLTPEIAAVALADLKTMLNEIRPLLKPVTAADIRERLLSMAERLRELIVADAPPAPPLASRPQALPWPLNPFYFVRQRPEA